MLFVFISDKDFAARDVKFVERTTVEHLLERPCFIDSGQCPRSAPILLGYEPSYRSFQKGPTVEGSSPSTSEIMPIKRRSIDIGTELGTSVLQTSETSTLPFAPGSSEGESVAKRRKIGEEEAEEASGLRALAPTEPSVPKSLSKREKAKTAELPKRPQAMFHINVRIRKSRLRLGAVNFTWKADL